MLGVVIEHPPKQGHHSAQGVVLDIGFGPYALEDLVPAEDLPRRFGKQHQQVHHPRFDGEHLMPFVEPIERRLDVEVADPKSVPRFHSPIMSQEPVMRKVDGFDPADFRMLAIARIQGFSLRRSQQDHIDHRTIPGQQVESGQDS